MPMLRYVVATVVGRGTPQEGIHDAFQGATLSTRLQLLSNVEPPYSPDCLERLSEKVF